MLTYTHTEIEQTLRNARLLFEKLDKVLDSPTEATEKYRLSIEQLVKVYQMHGDITQFKADLESQSIELSKLL
ncbi:MAG: hypothetical protein RLZZ574_3245 [Cyanobacteriota bacterium]|jgi:hypothetical protein